jgi:hypothetical protein
MTEKEFINEVGILPEHAHWAIKLRDGFAQSMGVSSDAVHPTDTIAYVSSFGFDNHSWGEINIYLSKSLAISIPSKFWVPLVKAKTAKEITIANIIRYFVEHRIELDCE